MFDWLNNIDMGHWVGSLGYVGLCAIVFSEMGIFFAFFLPGDSLVLTAGILAHKGYFHIGWLVVLLVLSAILGYVFGYWFGDKLGHWLMKRKDSIMFKKKYIKKSHDFYEKHGGKALMIGRFVPIVRTFAPIVAGMGAMRYRRFTLFNISGAIVWAGGMTLLGYFLGSFLPHITKIFLPLVLFIILLSILPGVIHFWREKKKTPNAKIKKKEEQ